MRAIGCLLALLALARCAASVESDQPSAYQLCASPPANCSCTWQSFHNLSRHNYLRVLACANYEQLNHFSSVISVVDLRHNGVLYLDQVLRRIIYREILMLNVARNDIFELLSTQFNRQYNSSWTSLQYLDLSANLVRSLDPTYFAIFPSLTHLLLDDNRISRLPEGAFAKLTRLRLLSLSGNPLKALEIDPFRPGYPAQMASLNLSRCQLEVADPAFFASLFFLSSLDLSHNRLAHLPSGGYPSLRALAQLSLAGNQFESVPTRFLRHFRRLEQLLLDRNPRIRRLAEGDLAWINASRISLRDCGLRVINAAAAHNLSYLTELDLAGNRDLSFVHSQAFSALYKLARLDLDSCHLHSLPGELAGQVLDAQVSLRYNPLWCVCDNAWISDSLHSGHSKMKFAHPEAMYCTAYTAVTPSRGDPFTVIERRHMINASVSESAGCPPHIFHPLSNLTIELHQGDRVILECLASGLPRPSVYWTFHDNIHLEASPADPPYEQLHQQNRLRLSNGLLDLRDARVSDSGRYACTVFNSLGNRSLTYVLVVQSRLLQLVPLSAGTDKLSVTWRGADRYHTEWYNIGYRQVDSYDAAPHRRMAFRSVYPIRQEWRSFTAHHLKPGRFYQFCLVHRHARYLHDNGSSEADIHEVKFPLVFDSGQCVTMRTKHSIQHLYGHGIYRAAHHSTVYIMLGMVFGFLFLCCLTALVYQRNCKKLRQTRKQYRYSTVSFRDGNTLQMKVLLDDGRPPAAGHPMVPLARSPPVVAYTAEVDEQYSSRTCLLNRSETATW